MLWAAISGQVLGSCPITRGCCANLRLLERHIHRSGKDSIDHSSSRPSPVFLFSPERSANLDPESPTPRRRASIRSITMVGYVPIPL
jgi:hypothetical protein